MAKTAKRRAANGAGTIRLRKDGLYEARYSTPDGRQHSIYSRDRDEVKRRLKQALAELTLGVWFEPSTLTLEAWVTMWLKDYTKHLKPTTIANYKTYMANYIIPELGKKKLGSIKTIHIQRVFNAMEVATSTQASVKIALSSALSTAVRFGLISANPCYGLKLGKQPEKDKVVIDRPDFPRFVAAAQKSPYYVAFMVLLQTGIRMGELRGLRWEDVDMDGKAIYIRQQISYIDGAPVVQTTKGYEQRKIALIDETARLFKEHKKMQAEARLRSGEWVDTDMTRDLVFRDDKGGLYNRTALNYPLRKLGESIGVKGLHPHALRDSYAIAALRSGVDVKTVQNNLGHKDATTTLNTYAKYTDDAGRVGADKFAAYWAENTTARV